MAWTCEAVIFDLDGVLVDSNAISERHMHAWAARHGIDFARIAAIHHGRPTVETVRLVAPHLDADAEARGIDADERADTCGLRAFAGATRLLAALPAGRWAIVTSGTRPMATTRLRAVGLTQPDVLITADDVERGKPAPDPYRLAMQRLAVAPARSIVIEDAPAGIASGRAAGARVIAVAATLPAAVLAEADVVLASLDDLEVVTRADDIAVAWRAAGPMRTGARYTEP